MLPKDDDALKSDNLGINIDLSIKYQGQIMYRCTHVLYSKPWPTSGSDDNQHKPCYQDPHNAAIAYGNFFNAMIYKEHELSTTWRYKRIECFRISFRFLPCLAHAREKKSHWVTSSRYIHSHINHSKQHIHIITTCTATVDFTTTLG